MVELDYDIVIIGAGIQGAGVAQAAAVCGYKTLVLEKFPEAGMGTSCKSSKLIHGGLRYLESGQFKLVRESLKERSHLLRNAPQLVKLIPFYIPVYKNSLRPAWLIWLGLCIYSMFSLKAFSRVKKEHWKALDGIKQEGLKAVFKYYDAQTDDKQLSQQVIHSAEKYGAKIIYQAAFITSHAIENKHYLTYRKNNQTLSVQCKCIVNCSGPWIESIQDKITPRLAIPALELVAGTHLIINKPLLCGAYYLEADDKRAIFVMPWKGKLTLIGTTETIYSGNIDKLAPTKDEITYLLNTYNKHFNCHIEMQHILHSFAGLRVLAKSEQAIFNQSRESMILHNNTQPMLISLVGGKLTTYRSSAEQVLLKIKKIIPAARKNIGLDTSKIPL